MVASAGGDVLEQEGLVHGPCDAFAGSGGPGGGGGFTLPDFIQLFMFIDRVTLDDVDLVGRIVVHRTVIIRLR